MKKLLFISLLFLVGFSGFGQITFQKAYGGINSEIGYSVQQCTDGGYIIAGQSTSFGAGDVDIYLIKTDENGDTLWTKTFGGAAKEFAHSVQQCFDGGYIITGFTESFGAGNYDVYLIKTDVNGDMLWNKTFGGTNSDFSYSVQLCADSGYIIAGQTLNFGAVGVYLIKTDAGGNTQWTKTYGGTIGEKGHSGKVCADGGYIIAGEGWSYGAGMSDIYLIKTNASGDTLWTKTYGGTDEDRVESIHQCTDGGYIIAGATKNYGAGSWSGCLIKTDSIGDTLWTKTYGGTGLESFTTVKQTDEGGYIIVGATTSFGPTADNVYLIKTDASGDTLWTKVFGGAGGDAGASIQQCTDGGYIITGYTSSFGVGGYDVYLIKTDANGNSGGCNEYNTNTIIGNAPFIISSGGIVGSGVTEGNPATIVSSPATVDSILCTNVGIEQPTISNNEIMVYPNPTTGKFTVQGASGELHVYDLFGRLLLRSKEAQIDMSSYPTGLYIWKIGTERGKIILE